jgi:alpha-glucosidase (family GH31 glycosyl hydrolase)
MHKKLFLPLSGLILLVFGIASAASAQHAAFGGGVRGQRSNLPTLYLDELFYETAGGRVRFPVPIRLDPKAGRIRAWESELSLDAARKVTLSVRPEGNNFVVRLSSQPDSDIVKWGFSITVAPDEYFTGLMERVVDGPQEASWAPGIAQAMNLRGQRVEIIVKPTTSIYAPFYLSSRGYAVFVKGTWPGVFDFAAEDPSRVKVEFEGPSLEFKVYTAADPAALVRAHALDAGPPFLPPRWLFTPWRWRDEHTQRTTYFDGTPVTGPFNSELMEDVLMMESYGIPNGVYWIDRPWGPGKPWGYDDFDIDEQRLPYFGEMVKWLDGRGTKTVLWIAPFYQGTMEREATAKGYTLAGQVRPSNGNNFPMVDLSNPAARLYWQDGIAKLLNLGVAGFKLDRGEENIPESGPFKLFDGRSIRENRNAYVVDYARAVYEVAQKHRGQDFALMPRGTYTGSSPYTVQWGGDIGGTQEGLRASIIAVQRSAVMGYPNWGSDTCGYNQQLLEQEVCGRWLAFSAFTPIMEVGPTRNVGFWNLPREPSYDATLIAIWRLYARLHQRLADYSYGLAQEATRTGTPAVRPLFMVEPQTPAAWSNWWTYQYGPDLLVSPIWEKGRRQQSVYLPAGSRWRDAWHPDKLYRGGQTITVNAELQQIPLFVRAGSKLELGDLNREWTESQALAQRKPDLKALDQSLRSWFDQHRLANGTK